ncbi:hypothetical protein ACLB1G_15770 [Oxalobacteraceae bacterium A2-2]
MVKPLQVDVSHSDRELLERAVLELDPCADTGNMTSNELITTLLKHNPHLQSAPVPVEPVEPLDNSPEAVEARRAHRAAAVLRSFGMWKDDPTKQQDGVEFQKELRAKW